MTKGLEALCYLDDIAHGRKMDLDPHELKLIAEKEHKALEIIVNKRVDMILLVHAFRVGYGFDFYNYRCEVGYELTQQEFSLLKEVISWFI